ncbi:related to RNA-directed RNA polymerase [Ustilago trichophora]|uniref:Related to RNA-directed RNA polymerase n=1 Tax=Ustilago trichophora TaxID=86804 RepID=A0A5C3DTM6_9BASI|nr:related to RNA-directed RNA polymerase [Ustilago trichophora]
MEVFVHNIPNNLDSKAIERFIFAVLQKEKVFALPFQPPPSSHGATATVSINKGFFFRRIERAGQRNYGLITFARIRVGEWFLAYAQQQSFVIKHRILLKEGRNTPSKAFVHAISENATDKQPSASVEKHAQIFRFGLAHIGYWSAPHRFSYTHTYSGHSLHLLIDERSVIQLILPQYRVSFLPRDMRGYNSIFVNPGTVGKDQVGAIFLFELKQNPQSRSNAAFSNNEHGFTLPSRVIRLSFAADERGSAAAERLWNALDSVLAGVRRINMRQVKMVQDHHNRFVESFFRRSKNLNIELAFLREALIRNELLNISALIKINGRLDNMISQDRHELALRVLKNFLPKLEVRQERGKDEEQVLKNTNKLWEEACKEAVANDSRGLITLFDPSQGSDDGHFARMLHIDVTPTRILLSGPQWHISNRVIRTYSDHWHHFARVMFTNEDREGVTTIKPNYGFAESEDYIQSRVLGILMHGLNVAGRHWELLAWSSSSMSTHTVWFVTPFQDASGRKIDANFIRSSLGDFSDVIRSPAQYGARLSQAFSATARTISVPNAQIQNQPDIKMHDGQVYTDGVGSISPELMAEVWESYVSIHGEHRKRTLLKASAPSAIQIRLGGSKGVLAVNPRLQGKVLKIRPSMTKFGSPHNDLEVANSSSRCLPAKLNRPLINALSDRGVPAAAFLDIQAEAIALIGRARSNFHEAAKLCSAYSFGTGCNLHALFEKVHKLGLSAKAVHDDSFLLVLAKSVTAAALGDMKRKARIPVRGVTLIGIADEFGFLKEGEVFAQVETVESGNVARRILTGKKLIGRSPTVDPGDVVMVTCVKPPPGHPLLQLRNVIVFDTCSRVQPLPRRLGGGDLDGDLMSIYEDARLFPETEQPAAVFHPKTQPATLSRDCGAYDLAHFFSEFMLNDFIGLVSHLHLRIADASDHGSNDPRCKELAKLHSQATDFRKTGKAVKRDEMPRHDEPIVPDFLAMGEKREGKLTYTSKRVLGYLYRAVSWGETDTPSLDTNTDPETGLVTVGAADCFEDDDVASLYGSDLSGMMEDRSTNQPIRVSSLRATLGSGVRATTDPTHTLPSGASIGGDAASTSPWQFKDVTFPQLLERIGWSYSSFLDSSFSTKKDMQDSKVVEEGHRYVAVFQDFTRQLRQVSRMIASYHPDVDKPWDGMSGAEAPMGGTLLVSEVHLLTGRLTWSKVARKTRAERDNSTLDNMRAVCTMLRKSICSISEAAAFGKIGGVSSSQTTVIPEAAMEIAGNGNQGQGSSADKAEESGTIQQSVDRTDGTANAPFEVLDDDDDAISVRSDSTVHGGSAANVSRVTSSNVAAAVKRKASQEAGMERRSRSHTPTSPLTLDIAVSPSSSRAVFPTSQASPVLLPADVVAQPSGEDEEEEDGELTARSAQKIVDSLWKACHFFCSPRRARYSNLYGYNTFMLTLCLHVLSMLETLKHLERNPYNRPFYRRNRANSAASSTATYDTTTSSTAPAGESGRIDRVAMQIHVNPNDDDDDDDYDIDDMDDDFDQDYSLTEAAMAAMDLGTVLLDLGSNDLGFDM